MKAKPFNKTKSIVTYVVCVILIVALAIGNYFAYLYKDLITVYTSGSDAVSYTHLDVYKRQGHCSGTGDKCRTFHRKGWCA